MVLLAVLCNIGFIVITLWYTLLSIPGFRWLDKFLYGIKAPPRPTPTWEEGTEDEEGFRHDFFFNGRVRLHYAHIGDVGKPLLLFLHGFPESWYSWRYQMKHFKNDYHCVAIDLRGYGDSDKPADRKDYRMALLVSDVAEAVKQLSPDGKTVLAAHDWGGAVAWTFVYDHPELLHKFVIMNLPHPSLFLKNFQRNEVQMKRSWYIFYFQIPFLAEYRLLEPGKGYVDQEDVDRSSKRDDKFVSISPPSSAAGAGIALERVLIGSMESPQNLSLKEARTITDGARKPGSITAMVNYYRNIFSLDAVLEQGKNAKRPIIEVPTLLVWGEKDTALGKELTVGTDQYVRNLTTFYVPEASHWVQQDAHEAVNQKMEEFLQA